MSFTMVRTALLLVPALICNRSYYGSLCVALFNLKCNMQNDNAICKMALHFVFKFIFYMTILATFGAK